MNSVSASTITAMIYAHALEDQKASAIADLSKRLQSEHTSPGDSQRDSHLPKNNPAPPSEERGIPHSSAGAGDGTRTRTGLPPTVFKTVASADSATPAGAPMIARQPSRSNRAYFVALAKYRLPYM